MKLRLPIDIADRVIASFPWRDKIIVTTELGAVFVVEVGEDFGSGEIKIRLMS